jgi:hypothetical protein
MKSILKLWVTGKSISGFLNVQILQNARIILKEDPAADMSREKNIKTFPAIIVLFLIMLLSPLEIQAGGRNFLSNSYWNGGKAEFQTYDAKIEKYGYDREAEVKIILVKEPFDLFKGVKSLTVPKSIDVIKMNYIQSFPVGVYEYNQMASIFFERSSGRILKYSMSSQDGCGHSYMQYTHIGEEHNFIFYSYFDDEGEIKRTIIESDPIYFYDALPLILRFRMEDKNPYMIKIFPGFISNKFTEPTASEVKVSKTLLENVTFNNIFYESVYSVVVNDGNKMDTFYFDTVYPHRLIKWKMNNKDELNLDKSSFTYYWKKIKPGDDITD